MTKNEQALLAVFAHPDDETFRPGGTLALLARQGVRVAVLTATRGQAGAVGDPPLCTPDELPGVRERELRCACAALGLAPPRLLNYRDGQVVEADPGELVARILTVVAAVRPQVLLTFGPDGLSGHPDHIAVGRAAAEAFGRAETIAALYTVAVPRRVAAQLDLRELRPVADDAIALTVDVAPVWAAKQAALRCHATQWSTSPMRRAPADRQRLFLGTEYFVLSAVRRPKADFMRALMCPRSGGNRGTAWRSRAP